MNYCLFIYFILSFALVATSLKSFWNVPLDRCSNLGINFNLSQFNIIHNTNNTFYGDKMNIMYEPGVFPRYTKAGVAINGGIPQLASIDSHISRFFESLNSTLKNALEGPIVLDMEDYLPSFIGSPKIYQEKSIELIRSLHPNWTTSEIMEEAALTFNLTVKPIFEDLLTLGKVIRPGALFGYYHYPYCMNYQPPCDHCGQDIMALNDYLRKWMYQESGALYPSLYTFEMGNAATYRTNLIATRMLETKRINDKKLPVYPYFWYRFKDSKNYLSKSIATSILWSIKQNSGDGVIIWGALSDLATKENCTNFKDYVDNTLGPLLYCFSTLPESISRFLIDYFPLTQKNESGESIHFNANQNSEIVVNFIDYLC